MIPEGILSALGAKGTEKILSKLADGPKRPKDLVKSSTVSEPTAYTRIRELEKHNIICACILEENKRTYKGYQLTELGKQIIELLTGGGI